MAGVLFVVNIPSHNFEKNENPIKRKNLQNEFNKNEDLAQADSDEIEISDPIEIEQNVNLLSKTPLSTPELQNIHYFKNYADSEGTLTTRKTNPSSINLAISIESFEQIPNCVEFRDKNLTKSQTLAPLSNKKPFQKSWEGFKDLLSPAKKDSSKEKENSEYAGFLNLAHNSSMEQVMREIIKSMKLESAAWIPTKDGDGYQIIFSIDSGRRCDETIRMLSEWGIGERDLSSVSVIPCTRYHKPFVNVEASSEKSDEQKENSWDKFLSSVRARLNVAQIVEEVKWDATITFDFLILLVVAAVLAAFGLVEDNTLFLAASMLISPLMGPIISAIFGTVIKDNKLRRMGVVNELIGIFAATFVGFLFGIIVCSIDNRFSTDTRLTKEMLSRCELHSVLVGILIALPSGAAVAIAILGENTGSLVGVAISASLLPPAVNAGLMWALACIYTFFEKDTSRYNSIITSKTYSDHQAIELLVFGSISMLLTITNVICIYVMGVLFLKIKEVAPVVSDNHKQFWKHDIKIARDYNKTLHAEDAAAYSERMAKELEEFRKFDKEGGLRGVGVELLRNGNLGSHQNTWSPLSTRHHQQPARTSVHDLEAIYLSLATHHPVDHYRYSKIPQPFYKKNWSPPKYRSIPDDTRSPSYQRRISNPLDAISPKTDKFKSASAPLSRIAEMSQSTLNFINNKGPTPPAESSNATESGKAKKFTVTPAVIH